MEIRCETIQLIPNTVLASVYVFSKYELGLAVLFPPLSLFFIMCGEKRWSNHPEASPKYVKF